MDSKRTESKVSFFLVESQPPSLGLCLDRMSFLIPSLQSMSGLNSTRTPIRDERRPQTCVCMCMYMSSCVCVFMCVYMCMCACACRGSDLISDVMVFRYREKKSLNSHSSTRDLQYLEQKDQG